MAVAGVSPRTAGETVTGPELRGFMRAWPTGVAIVTSAAAGQPVGCTVNAFTSVSLDPPTLLVCMAAASRTLAVILRRGTFAVNLLGARQRRLAESFASPAGDRFRSASSRLVRGMPVFDESIAVTVCELESSTPVADHVLLLGTPVWCSMREPGDGHDGPLVFFAGQYLPRAPQDPPLNE